MIIFLLSFPTPQKDIQQHKKFITESFFFASEIFTLEKSEKDHIFL